MTYRPNSKCLSKISKRFRSAESMSDLLPESTRSATESAGETLLSPELEQDLKSEFRQYLISRIYTLIRDAKVLFSPGSEAIQELKSLLDDPEIYTPLAAHLDEAAHLDTSWQDDKDIFDTDKVKLIVKCNESYSRYKTLSNDLAEAKKDFEAVKEELKSKYDWEYNV